MHTDIPTRSTVERLLSARDASASRSTCRRAPHQDARASRIELKNLCRRGAGSSRRRAPTAAGIEAIREELDELVDDEEFWGSRRAASPCSPRRRALRTFRLPNRLPAVVEVADRSYVKPLLRAITFPQAAFVLALASGSVRLIEVLRDGPPFTVSVPGPPEGRGVRRPQGVDHRPLAERRGSRARRGRSSGSASTRARSSRRSAASSRASSCR